MKSNDLQLVQILQEIIQHGYLEDRREYCTEDLALAYFLNDDDAKVLFNLIQSFFK